MRRIAIVTSLLLATLAFLATNGCGEDYEGRVAPRMYVGWCATLSPETGRAFHSHCILHGDRWGGASIAVKQVAEFGEADNVVYGRTSTGWFLMKGQYPDRYTSEADWRAALTAAGIMSPQLRAPPTQYGAFVLNLRGGEPYEVFIAAAAFGVVAVAIGCSFRILRAKRPKQPTARE